MKRLRQVTRQMLVYLNLLSQGTITFYRTLFFIFFEQILCHLLSIFSKTNRWRINKKAGVVLAPAQPKDICFFVLTKLNVVQSEQWAKVMTKLLKISWVVSSCYSFDTTGSKFWRKCEWNPGKSLQNNELGPDRSSYRSNSNASKLVKGQRL